MKKTLFALMACVMTFSSCSDDDENDFDLGLLEGSWAEVHYELHADDGENYVEDIDLGNLSDDDDTYGVKITKTDGDQYKLIEYWWTSRDGWTTDDYSQQYGPTFTIKDKTISIIKAEDGFDNFLGKITRLTATNMTVENEGYDDEDGVKWYDKTEYVRVNDF